MNRSDIVRDYVKAHPQSSSTEIFEGIGQIAAYATVRRDLAKLVDDGVLLLVGKGKSSRYMLSPAYELFQPIDLNAYFGKEIDERQIHESYNFDLIEKTLSGVALFTRSEITYLDARQKVFAENLSKLSAAQYRKEMERLGVDLSWKSSQIEGNTYSLLETERLLLEKPKTATSSGIFNPFSFIASIAPMAISSLIPKMASGIFFIFNNR